MKYGGVGGGEHLKAQGSKRVWGHALERDGQDLKGGGSKYPRQGRTHLALHAISCFD